MNNNNLSHVNPLIYHTNLDILQLHVERGDMLVTFNAILGIGMLYACTILVLQMLKCE